LPPLVQAEVAQQEARGLAMTGEPAGSVDAKLDEAWNLLNDAECVPGELGSRYDRLLLTMQTAICYCEAGQPGRAVELYRSELTDERFPRRDQGYFLSLMASALAQAAEPDTASDAAHEALTVALQTKSQRTMQELVRVCALLEPWRAQPAVRDLRDAVLPLA
jgi:ATP/maltotriose-dependent transcriptional regulator MalT